MVFGALVYIFSTTNHRDNDRKDVMKEDGIIKDIGKILVLGVLVFSAIYFIDVVRTQDTLRQVEKGASDPTSQPVVDPRVARHSYMSSCDDGSLDSFSFDQTEYCACTFDSIVAEKGLNWLGDLGLNGSEKDKQDTFATYGTKCLKTQGVEV